MVIEQVGEEVDGLPPNANRVCVVCAGLADDASAATGSEAGLEPKVTAGAELVVVGAPKPKATAGTDGLREASDAAGLAPNVKAGAAEFADVDGAPKEKAGAVGAAVNGLVFEAAASADGSGLSHEAHLAASFLLTTKHVSHFQEPVAGLAKKSEPLAAAAGLATASIEVETSAGLLPKVMGVAPLPVAAPKPNVG